MESKYGLCAISVPAHASLFHTPSIFPQIGDRLFDFWKRVCEVRIETQDATEKEAQLTVS